jgi:hypothetical protein
VGLYLLIVDVTCVKSLRSSYGVVSPDSPSRGCQGEWMVLRGVVSPEFRAQGFKVTSETLSPNPRERSLDASHRWS